MITHGTLATFLSRLFRLPFPAMTFQAPRKKPPSVSISACNLRTFSLPSSPALANHESWTSVILAFFFFLPKIPHVLIWPFTGCFVTIFIPQYLTFPPFIIIATLPLRVFVVSCCRNRRDFQISRWQGRFSLETRGRYAFCPIAVQLLNRFPFEYRVR